MIKITLTLLIALLFNIIFITIDRSNINANMLFVIVWCIDTGRCVNTISCGGIIRSVAWCPNETISLIAAAVDKKIFLINPKVPTVAKDIIDKTDQVLEVIPQSVKTGTI
jgi:hypothetical protein